MMRFLRKWIDDVLGRANYRRHLERQNRGRRIRAQLFTIAGALTTLAYLLWLPFVLVADVWWLAVPFLGAEIFSRSGGAPLNDLSNDEPVVSWIPERP